VINNARFIGDRMGLKETDILCCPPPLFHCFGLVLGLLAIIAKGATIVFPSETFDAAAVVGAVLKENCTALHGVPAMWSAEMDLVTGEHDFSRLRTGIAAGSATTRQMMRDIREKLHLDQVTNTYGLREFSLAALCTRLTVEGMTETSPASFMTSWDDDLERRLTTVGRILPHTVAKIIDLQGNIVPLGHRGELCVSGYLLQAGYWNNPEKTAEAMRKGERGVLWMHTGDEACFDEEGYCRITGRIKDMIIRGKQGFRDAPSKVTAKHAFQVARTSSLSRSKKDSWSIRQFPKPV
jgi:long-chain acyl-CoA synthetase